MTNNATARYYSSQYGRFLSTDPLAGDITDPQTLNKYAYVRNNPIGYVDPSGMDHECAYGSGWCLGNEPGSGGDGGNGGGE